MIAHKLFKVIVGIMLVVLLISTSVMSSFASSPVPTDYRPENLNPLEYPYYVQMMVSQAYGSSFSAVPVVPYRDGNSFYLPLAPYESMVQFTFSFSDSTILDPYRDGLLRPDSSPSTISTSAPNGMEVDSTLPIHIDSLELSFTVFGTYNTGGGDNPIYYDDILDDSDIRIMFLRTGSASSAVADFSEPVSNPFSFEWYSITGGIDGVERLVVRMRFNNYPNHGFFAPDYKITFDHIIINGTELAEEQIITEANNEMSSIYQRLSDYSLEHLTEVDLNDILNNVDNASNSVEDVRFLSIFDGIYGYGIIPTLITLSLCISFVGYLLFGKSG